MMQMDFILENTMNAVILACTSLTEYVKQAQANMGTSYPVLYLDRSYHKDPKMMRQQVLMALEDIPEEYDTVLVAMGYCGGSWEGIPADRRIVLPRVDDCISLLMTVDDLYMPDRKEEGCLYVKEEHPHLSSFRAIFESYTEDMEQDVANKIHAAWKENYHGMRVIDTGMYDCRTDAYMESVYADADWLEADQQKVLLFQS